jgi:hypothetical protein
VKRAGAILWLALAPWWFATPAWAELPLTELTVDGHDYPVCEQEDCSDQPGQIGLWEDTDTGDWYLSTGETSTRIIDDTVTGGTK